MFSRTYILCDKAGGVKPTFVSELEQYVNIFSQFTIFCEKMTKIQRISGKITIFFWLKNNYTSEKEFSLALRKLDGSPKKNFREKFQ